MLLQLYGKWALVDDYHQAVGEESTPMMHALEMAGRIEPPVRIGIVGMGDFGLFCMEAFGRSDSLRVVAAADPRPDLAQRANQVSRAGLFSDWRDLIAQPSVEVVHVATPPWTHAEIAAEAAAAGKSAFVEKPLALSLDDVDRTVAAFESRALTLGINYVMRHSPIYRFLIDLCRTGLLGSARRISLDNGAQATPAGHWFWDRSKSGGILVEHGVHFFDVFRQISGDSKAVRTVDGGARILAEVEYNSGCWGSVYHDFTLDTRVEHANVAFVFTEGTAEVGGWIPETLEVRAIAPGAQPAWQEVLARHSAAKAQFDGAIVTASMRVGDRRQAYLDAITAGMLQVARAHRHRDFQPDVTPADARASLALAIDAQRIAHTS
jgi:predicted dehydrogenase